MPGTELLLSQHTYTMVLKPQDQPERWVYYPCLTADETKVLVQGHRTENSQSWDLN